jgi:hypothetical protein
MATITSQGCEFVPEIWNEIKEYAGIYHISTNLIHFDKLTYEELVDNDDLFSSYLDVNSFDTHHQSGDGFQHFGEKWYDEDHEIVPKKVLYEDFVGEIKSGYKYGVGDGIDKKEFWIDISNIIAISLKKAEDKKIAAAWGRKKNKEFKETVKGMTQDIIKMEEEERKLVERMEKDAEKLKKLKAKRGKLEKKRQEKYGN